MPQIYTQAHHQQFGQTQLPVRQPCPYTFSPQIVPLVLHSNTIISGAGSTRVMKRRAIYTSERVSEGVPAPRCAAGTGTAGSDAIPMLAAHVQPGNASATNDPGLAPGFVLGTAMPTQLVPAPQDHLGFVPDATLPTQLVPAPQGHQAAGPVLATQNQPGNAGTTKDPRLAPGFGPDTALPTQLVPAPRVHLAAGPMLAAQNLTGNASAMSALVTGCAASAYGGESPELSRFTNLVRTKFQLIAGSPAVPDFFAENSAQHGMMEDREPELRGTNRGTLAKKSKGCAKTDSFSELLRSPDPDQGSPTDRATPPAAPEFSPENSARNNGSGTQGSKPQGARPDTPAVRNAKSGAFHSIDLQENPR